MGQSHRTETLVASSGIGLRDLARDAAWHQLSSRLNDLLVLAIRRKKARGEQPHSLRLRLESPEGVAIRTVHLGPGKHSFQAWQAAALGALRLAWGELPPGPLRLRVTLLDQIFSGAKVVPFRRRSNTKWPQWHCLWKKAQKGFQILVSSLR